MIKIITVLNIILAVTSIIMLILNDKAAEKRERVLFLQLRTCWDYENELVRLKIAQFDKNGNIIPLNRYD